jgi:triosephosphate isomerase
MTTPNVRALVAGNWKMNGLKGSLSEVEAVIAGLAGAGCDVMIAPPATLVSDLAGAARGTALAIGAQDCHAKAVGAHTGDVSAEMLADAGATFVIVGHSERRSDHSETDSVVRAKAEAAHRAGLTAIVCVGETADERKSGRTLDIVRRQLDGSLPVTPERTVVAYEPVWAIGTGLTPTAADVAEVHAAIRSALVERYSGAGKAIRILYGGSVKPSNARELMAVANVDGALVGGASLKAADFLGIIAAYTRS